MISRTPLRLQRSHPRAAIQRDGQAGSVQNWNGPGLIGEASPNEGATSVAVVSRTLIRNGVPSICAEQPSQRAALFSAMIVGMRMPFTSIVPLIVPEPAAPWRRALPITLVVALLAAGCGPAGDPTDPAAEVRGDGKLQELLIRHDSRDPAYRLEGGAVEVDGGPWCQFKNPKTGKTITVKDSIADAFLQQILLRPAEYDTIVTTNLNGDYISDALAAEVGGLGIAPGGWAQVVRKQVPSAEIVGIDLLPVEPIEGVTIFQMDFMADEAPAALTDALGGPPDLVLSDMAANTVGHKATDHLRTMGLVETAAHFAIENLSPGGAFVAAHIMAGGQGRRPQIAGGTFAQHHRA